MSQYKVLQDIEAEDKLLGPLSLRQFIYAVIVVVLGFVAWRLLMVQWLLAIPFVPPLIFFMLLAAPFGRDQSSEIWLLAKIKYFVFPRKRIWNQDGIQNHVTITVPKVEQKQVTKDFDKNEATSRLKALASTMDTRGWAIKNTTGSGYQSPASGQAGSDRLLDLQVVSNDELVNVKPSEDVLDTNNTPLAQTMGSLQAQSQQNHRQDLLLKMQTLAAKQRASQSNLATLPVPAKPQAQPIKVAQPVKPAPKPVKPSVQQPVTQAQAPAILKEVKSPQLPTELSVKQTSGNKSDDSNEVVVSLH